MIAALVFICQLVFALYVLGFVFDIIGALITGISDSVRNVLKAGTIEQRPRHLYPHDGDPTPERKVKAKPWELEL